MNILGFLTVILISPTVSFFQFLITHHQKAATVWKPRLKLGFSDSFPDFSQSFFLTFFFGWKGKGHASSSHRPNKRSITGRSRSCWLGSSLIIRKLQLSEIHGWNQGPRKTPIIYIDNDFLFHNMISNFCNMCSPTFKPMVNLKAKPLVFLEPVWLI